MGFIRLHYKLETLTAPQRVACFEEFFLGSGRRWVVANRDKTLGGNGVFQQST